MTRNIKIAASCGVIALLGVGTLATVYQTRRANEAARARLTYQADGYGGFTPKSDTVPMTRPVAKTTVAPSPAPTTTAPNPTLAPALIAARTAYAKGDYKAAETSAKEVVASAPKQKRASVAVASAEHLMAFAAARQGDLKTARQRFAQARKDAETLPKASPSPTAPGELPQPSLAEDSAYQHAACTMGLGDKAGAERELVQFMRDFPESPLVHGAMRRIAKMHGGDIPKDVEVVWNSAQAIQRKSQEKRERDAAMCGPETVAELLKRQGKMISVESLAKEMKTNGNGSSLAAMQKVMQARGFASAQGVQLTQKGLEQQSLPVVTLVQPGHFVLVEKIDASTGTITIWDNSGTTGQGVPSYSRAVSAADWKLMWSGVALTTKQVVNLTKQTVKARAMEATSEGGKQTL